MASKLNPLICGECNGTGTLTQPGGDWGRTPDRQVPCWACAGTGLKKGPVAS